MTRMSLGIALTIACFALLACGCAATPKATPASRLAMDNADPYRPLVGVSYFAGWWPPPKSKWRTPSTGVDWREKFPERIPMLGEYNTQDTMDKEIVAAAPTR